MTKVPTPSQLCAARAGLRWNLRRASAATGITRNSLSLYERGRGRPTLETLIAIRDAYVQAGVQFTDIDGKPAVALPE